MKNLQKSTLFYFVTLLLVTSFSYSQKLINEDEVTSTFLKETFSNAYIEVLDTKDTFIKVKDIFNVYLDIENSKSYVAFNSTYNLVENANQADALALMNKINSEVALVKVHYTPSSNSITYYYYFWTKGGFTQKAMINAFKLYVSALKLSLEKDTLKLIK
jgi:hypothetical protein